MVDKRESIFLFHTNIILSSLSLLVKSHEPDPTHPPAIYTVYVLTFTGLNFRGFRGSAAIRESFIPQKFRPVWQRVCVCKMIVSQMQNGGDSLGQLDMQLRTSTKAIDCINATRIQRKRQIKD